MQRTRTTRNRIRARRRQSNAGTLTFGRLLTTMGMGVILLLVAVTFVGDYLRVPRLTVSAQPGLISPNGDGTQDTTSLSYALSEEATVTVEVVNADGVVVKTLTAAEHRPAGQYVVLWDGADDDGRVVADGRYSLRVTAKGTARAAVQSADVQVDTQPPPLRLTNLEGVARVASPGLTIEGVTEPGAVVYQAGNAEAITVDANGFFKIERQLTEGVNILEILASDAAGNTARTSHEVTLITQPPELSIATPANDQWLNEAVLEVTGVAPAAASVTVNGQPALLQDDGSFRREVILQEGDNTLRIEATDDVGNVTAQERVVHLKTRPPTLSLNLEEGSVFQQATIQLTGRTDPGSTVLVNNRVVAVSPLGEFQTTLNLINGRNTIRVETRDVAGNTFALTRHVLFESPGAENELERFLNNLPSLSSLGTPLLILLPSLLLLGYLFSRPISLQLITDAETFTPGLPEEGKVLTLTLDLSRSARTTVEVLNPFNRPVATITHRRQRDAGQHTLYWDGYDDYGHVLPAGEYTVQATASTPTGTVRSVVPLTIHEDPLVSSRYGRQKGVPAVGERPVVVQRGGRRGRN